MADEFGEKTEQATDRRREDVREKGQVAHSADLTAAASCMAAAAVLHFLGQDLSLSLIAVLRQFLDTPAWTTLDLPSVMGQFWKVGQLLLTGLMPILAVMLVTGVAINLVQVGFLYTTEPLMPDLNRLNPVNGFQRLFSARAGVKLAGSVLKLVVLVTIVLLFMRRRLPQFLNSNDIELGVMYQQVAELLVSLAFQLALGLALLALLDFGFQLWQHEKDMRMSKEELKEEMRNFDGDPRIRQRRREVHRKLVQSRQIQQVKTADVVVTNPTHIAVALKYDPKKMQAPIVVAKGVEGVAERIRQVAREHGVPVIEKKPLARALYRDVKIGHPIPTELYDAVAEILGFVYRLKGKKIPTA